MSSLDVIYDLAIKRLDAQIEEIEGIDKKFGDNLQFASLIIAIPITFLTIRPTQITMLILVPFMAALLIYLSILVLTVLGYGFQKLSYLAPIRKLRDHLIDLEADYTKKVILNIIMDNIESNKTIIYTKARVARISFSLQYPLLAFVVTFLTLVVLN